MAQPTGPGQPNPNVDRSGTMIETEEDVRQALLSGLKGRPPVPVGLPEAAPSPRAVAAPPPPAVAKSASPFWPTARPPFALLTVFDDGWTSIGSKPSASESSIWAPSTGTTSCARRDPFGQARRDSGHIHGPLRGLA
jgi:hypothetical protein